MSRTTASKQSSFRRPQALVHDVENRAHPLRSQGLEVTRADVARLLRADALRTTPRRLTALLQGASNQQRGGA